MRLDQIADTSNRELYDFLNGIDVPEFVKEAELDNEDTLKYSSKTAFADEYAKSFPINTPARVYVSHAFLHNKKAALEKKWGKDYVEKVSQRIKIAGDLFKITDSLVKYTEQRNNKQAQDYSEVNICSISHAGKTFDLFPVKTASDFQTSMESFIENINKFPFPWRQKIAKSFIEKAAEFEVDEVPDLLAKYAGLYYANIADFPDILAHRFTKIASKVHALKYAALIERSKKVTSNKEAFDIVTTAAEIESQAGVTNNTKIASVIGDIVDRVFSLDVEKVAELLDCVQMGGEKFDVNALKKISKEVYKEAFGCDIDPVDATQLRDVLPTMPLSDVALFKEISGLRAL